MKQKISFGPFQGLLGNIDAESYAKLKVEHV